MFFERTPFTECRIARNDFKAGIERSDFTDAILERAEWMLFLQGQNRFRMRHHHHKLGTSRGGVREKLFMSFVQPVEDTKDHALPNHIFIVSFCRYLLNYQKICLIPLQQYIYILPPRVPPNEGKTWASAPERPSEGECGVGVLGYEYIDIYPPGGILLPVGHTHDSNRNKITRRLKIIGGQIRGLEKMVEGGTYCIDVITQTSAVKQGLSNVEDLLLENHLGTCVLKQVAAGQTEKAKKEILKVYQLKRK